MRAWGCTHRVALSTVRPVVGSGDGEGKEAEDIKSEKMDQEQQSCASRIENFRSRNCKFDRSTLFNFRITPNPATNIQIAKATDRGRLQPSQRFDSESVWEPPSGRVGKPWERRQRNGARDIVKNSYYVKRGCRSVKRRDSRRLTQQEKRREARQEARLTKQLRKAPQRFRAGESQG